MNLKPIKGSGVYKISELTADVQSGTLRLKKGQRYLECTTAGTIAFPSQQSFGCWEWDWYKGADGNEIGVSFISANTSINISYQIGISNTENIYLDRYGASRLMQTATSYIQNSNWYRIRITRTLTGSFTVLIKGGNFTPTAGYDGWTLVSTTGGSGTNPVVNLTYTTSNFMVFDLDAGDCITNILLKDSIKQ